MLKANVRILEQNLSIELSENSLLTDEFFLNEL